MTNKATQFRIFSLSSAAALALAMTMSISACNGAAEDDSATETLTTETGEPTGDGDGDPTGDGDGDPTGDGDGDPATGDGDGDPTDTDGDAFVFDESPPGDYAQLDRMGMPAINTAVITSKDAYNADNPASDIAGTYVPEIITNLEGLHAALDDDLADANLTPCAVMDCVAQAGPLVIPDTLTLTLTGAAGFPNGRLLADPVMDVTLAVVLLDLQVEEVTALVGVNPTANDVAFPGTFPYLAAPN